MINKEIMCRKSLSIDHFDDLVSMLQQNYIERLKSVCCFGHMYKTYGETNDLNTSQHKMNRINFEAKVNPIIMKIIVDNSSNLLN
jgi:hypothetical protein